MEYTKDLLSVCCVGYNHAAFAAQNIKAVWASPYRNIELIILDDGSSDNSKETLTLLQKESPIPMQVILQENTGNVGLNGNRALSHACGEYVTFLSLDDVLITSKIADCVDMLKKQGDLAFIAASRIETIDSRGNSYHPVAPMQLDEMDNPDADDLLMLELHRFGSFYIQGCYFRREIIDAVGGFDEDMTGDDIVLRTKVFRYLKAHPCRKFKVLHEATCRYRRHENNISHNGTRQIKIVAEYLEKYWPNEPNPKIFIDWFLAVTHHFLFERTVQTCAVNRRTASLLTDPRVLKDLRRKMKRETGLLRFFYFKEYDGEKRTITLLSLIKIHYVRKRKTFL